jgi:hypothetical protein
MSFTHRKAGRRLSLPGPGLLAAALLASLALGQSGNGTNALGAASDAALAGQTLHLSIQSGAPPFPTNGNYQIILALTGQQYSIPATNGIAAVTGNWSSSPVGLGVTRIVLGNYFSTSGAADLDLQADGVYSLRAYGRPGSQSGTWTMSSTGGGPVAPAITSQPQSQTLTVGDVAGLFVTAVGTPPLSYQWRKDGTGLLGANTDSLFLTDLNSTHPGAYSVVVANSVGSVTSLVATLTVTTRQLRLTGLHRDLAGGKVIVTNELVALTNENQISFSVVFDPAVLANPLAVVTVDATDTNTVVPAPASGPLRIQKMEVGPTATINTDTSQVAQGRFGVTVTLPAGAQLAPGRHAIAALAFDLAPGRSQWEGGLDLASQPLPMQAKDPAGNLLPLAAALVAVVPAAESGPMPTAVSVETGLFTQLVTIGNPGRSGAVHVRILVRGLSNDLQGNPITIFNLAGTTNSLPYLEFGPVIAGQALQVPIELYVSDRQPDSLTNLALAYEVQPTTRAAVLPVSDLRLQGVRRTETIAGPEGTNIVEKLRLAFDTSVNKYYYVQYRDDFLDASWKTILPALRGYGQPITWIDPAPIIPPTNRFYRVMQLP